MTNMKTLELNEQSWQWLQNHLLHELQQDYSETSNAIMRHILSKLEN